MTYVLEYDEHYNKDYFDYWAMQWDEFCTEGEVDGRWLVLSQQPIEGYRTLVDLQIVKSYVHNDYVYIVEPIDRYKYKTTKSSTKISRI